MELLRGLISSMRKLMKAGVQEYIENGYNKKGGFFLDYKPIGEFGQINAII